MARKIYRGYARDGNGTILSSATVYVYLTGTSTAASVYTASSGGTAVNSVTSDSTGLYKFYTDYSDYTAGTQFRIVISKTGYDSVTYDEVECLPPTFSTDGTLTDNSDADFPSEKAVKTYVDTSTAAQVSDAAYGSDWNNITTIAPSKNAVYDEFVTVLASIATREPGGVYALTDGATIAVDWSNGATQYVTLGATGRTVTFANPVTGMVYRLIIFPNETGTITTWPVAVKWSGGAAPTLSTEANAIDIVTLLYVGETWYADCAMGFATPA